jgi:hypothetical protein
MLCLICQWSSYMGRNGSTPMNDNPFSILYMLRSNLLTLINNKINISAENLNEQVIWSQRKNFLKNFSKDKKKHLGQPKPE